MGIVQRFFIGITSLIQAVSILFSAVDSEVYAKYIQVYQSAIHTAALRILTTTNRACFQGLVVIRNLAAHPHKDTSDYKNGWVVLVVVS